MADNVFQLKWYCSTGVWPRGAHVRQRCGRSLSPLSSMKTMVRPSFLAFFLTPASASASIAESWLRPVPAPGPSVAGNSNPAAVESARLARDRTALRTPARSAGPPATTSTGWFHNPVPVAPAANRARCAASLAHSGAACARPVRLSSAPAVPLAAADAPTGRSTADVPLRGGRLPTGYSPCAAAAPPPSAAAPEPQSPCALPLDCPSRNTTNKTSPNGSILFNPQ